MSRKISLPKFLFFTACIVIIGVFFFIYLHVGNNVENLPLIGFIISIVSSICASMIFSVLEDNVFSTKKDEQLAKLSNATHVLENMKTKGIIQLRCRHEYESRYWSDFLRTADSKLILSGKTLFRWIDDSELRDIFAGIITKKVMNGCVVTFIIYKEESLNQNDRVERAKFKEYLFQKIFPRIYKEGGKPKGKLTIKETERLPYFYIMNGVESLAMPYFAHVSNSANLAYRMKCDNTLNQSYYDDYQHIINMASDCPWKEEFFQTRGKKVKK